MQSVTAAAFVKWLPGEKCGECPGCQLVEDCGSCGACKKWKKEQETGKKRLEVRTQGSDRAPSRNPHAAHIHTANPRRTRASLLSVAPLTQRVPPVGSASHPARAVHTDPNRAVSQACYRRTCHLDPVAMGNTNMREEKHLEALPLYTECANATPRAPLAPAARRRPPPPSPSRPSAAPRSQHVHLG